MLLELAVGIITGLLIVAGILVIMGPSAKGVLRRLSALRPSRPKVSVFQAAGPREVVPPGLNPKTQRVMVAAARLANWLRAHNHDDLSRELRGAAARLAGDEPAGLYAMQTVLRRLRSLSPDDRAGQDRLRILANELRTAVQDRFEQLELLPFRRP